SWRGATPSWSSAQTGGVLRVALSRVPKCASGSGPQRTPGLFPLAFARVRKRDPAGHAGEGFYLGAPGFGLGVVVLRENPLDLLVAAHADARPRIVDAPAADALPYLDAIRHGYSVTSFSFPPSSMMRSAVRESFWDDSARSADAAMRFMSVRFGSKAIEHA